MTVNNPTTNYSWILPTEGGSDGTWGTELNEMMADLAGAIESIDEKIAELQVELDAEELRITDADERSEQLEANAPRPAYARVYLDASESVADGVAEDLSFLEDFDKNGCFDTSTPTRLTIPSTYDGLFTVRGVVRVPSWSGADNDSPIWRARITKNVGATVISEARFPHYNDNFDSASGDQTLIVEALVSAVGADYFELEIYYDTNSEPGSATRTVIGGKQNTYFEIYRHRSPLVSLPASAVGDPIYSSSSSSTDSHSVLLPTADRVAGDMLIFVFSPRANPALSAEPSGYTQLSGSGAESIVHDHYVYARRITAAEAGGGSVSGWILSIARESVAVAFHLRGVHLSSDPEIDHGMGSGSGNSDCDVTPSWGTDETFWLGVVGWDAANDLTAVPSGWTATDVETPDPDSKKSPAASAAIGAATLEQAGAQVTFGDSDWPLDSGLTDLGTLIAVRGIEAT